MDSSTLGSVRAASAASRAFERLAHDRSAWLSAAAVLLFVLAGIFGPIVMGVNGPNTLSDAALVGPGLGHPLGTDELGRDVLTLLVYGVRTSLVVGVLAALLASLLGVLIGAVAGYVGGKIDTLVMCISEIFQVMPNFILAAVVVAMAGPGTLRIVLVIALLSWPQVARIMRGEVMRVKELEYVDASRCLGMKETSILAFEVVPNAVSPVIAVGTLIVGQAILLESALSFFGLTPPDVPSWGLMLSSGQRFFYQAWWLSVFPGVFILATVLAFNFLGDAIGKAFNPRIQEKT